MRNEINKGIWTSARVWVVIFAGLLTLAGLTVTAVTEAAQEKIAFIRLVGGGVGYEIFTMDPDGNNQTQLTNGPGSPARPAFSPDGSLIAFDYQLGFDNPDIYVMYADGTGQSNLTGDDTSYNYQPSFSPDGSKIVFMSSRDGKLEIYVMNADGSGQTRVTDNDCQEQEPSFSPDGKKILFEGRCNFVRDIYVVSVDGTGLTNITPNADLDCCSSDFRPAFSPDGSRIVFASDRDGPYELYIMNSDGTAPTRLTFTGTDDQPTFSPDGNRIAFMSTRDAADNVYVMNLVDLSVSRLTLEGGSFPSWWGPAPVPPPTPTVTPTPSPEPTPLPNALPGTNVIVNASPAVIIFSAVTSAGETTLTEIDPAAAGTVPGGYSLGPGLPAYEISTTAQYTAPITVCIVVQGITDETVFAGLRILHGENGVLVDQTILPPDSPAPDFELRSLCARVNSLSPFAVAQQAAAVYGFSGFFQPVENLPAVNIATAGSAIPVKFSLNGNRGLAIFAAGYPGSRSIACDASESGTVIEETVNAGGSALSYDAGTDQYTFVWKTERSWKQTCLMLAVRLVDGSEHYAKFRFR